MVKLFDELAYSHYQNSQWESMFRQKFRLRFEDYTLSDELLTLLNDRELAKKFFRINRSELIKDMNKFEFYYPVTLENIIYFSNLSQVFNANVKSLTPGIMIEDFEFYKD